MLVFLYVCTGDLLYVLLETLKEQVSSEQRGNARRILE